MTNTLENKARFFAQYWGQEVAIQNDGGGTGFVYDINEYTITDIRYDFLELTPLSQISDEDAIALGYKKGAKSATTTFRGILGGSTIEADYLRSRGYALPWMGLSVETLVEWGWVKLRGGEND